MMIFSIDKANKCLKTFKERKFAKNYKETNLEDLLAKSSEFFWGKMKN